ncbi:MAG TPA: PRC-barrel domain-containing protein [Gaiellaceae bacterium]|nr:PRC-barrel domain-containing protein [Gaiellaceae bacterium]
MRTLTSLRRRKIVTESGETLGRCHDLRAELTGSSLRITGLVLGGRGRLEHFGIGAQASASSLRVRDSDLIPWEQIVRLEGDRIIVRDRTELALAD